MTKSKILNSFKLLLIFLIFGLFIFAGCSGEKSKDALFLDGGNWTELNDGLAWAGTDIVKSLPDWQKMLVQNGYNLSIIKELGFYLESEVPEDLIFNEILTSTYDRMLNNSKKKNLVKVYTSEDDTKIAFASEQKIQAPSNSEMLFANVWKYAYDVDRDCYVNLEVLNLSNFYTDNVTNMRAMFYSCDSLKTLNLKTFNTSKVTNMSMMFANCWNLTKLDLSNISLEKVTNADMMLHLTERSELSELILPLNWGRVFSLEVEAKYDLFDEESGEQFTEGGNYSEVFENYAGMKLIAGDPITFYVDGVKDETLTPNHYIDKQGLILPTPNRDNYIFSGWFDNKDCEGTPIEEILIGETGPKTFYGKTTPCRYWITYMVNGKEYSSSTYTYGVGTTLLNLSRDGWTFSGWYENENLTGSKVTAISTTDYNPKIFYATLTGKTYQIKYYVNGTAKSYTPSSYTCGEGVTLPNPTQNHYNFSGWFDNASCEGSIITQISDEDFGSKVYYANLVPETYNITYIVDNEEDKTLTPKTYAYNTNTTLPQPTKEGHTFSGWYTNSSYTSGKVVSISTTDAGNKTFYGHFERDTYTISYFVDGKEETYTPATYVYGTSVTLPQPTKEGHTFSGWYTNSSYTSGKVVSINTTDAGNKTFYGHFEKDTYTISYYVDGKEATYTPTTYVYGTNVTLPQPTKECYVFSGWYDNASCEGSMVTQISDEDFGNKVYYAKWNPATYNITYIIDNQENTTLTPKTYEYGTNVTLPKPSMPGYAFSGWFDNENYTGSVVTTISETETGNKQFYGKFTLAPVEFPKTWKTEIANFRDSISYDEITQIDFCSEAPSDYTLVDTLSTGIKVYKYGTKVAFVWAKTIYLPADMSSMFYGCSKLTSLDLSSFDTSSVTDMSYMFYGCLALTSLNLSNFNTSSVTNMSSMFAGCNRLAELDLSKFNTSSVTNMSSMFYGCSSLTSLDFSSFNTSSVTNMSSMFRGCSNLTTLNVSKFNTSNVTDMSYMFSSCKDLAELNISSFDTSNVTNWHHMFDVTFASDPDDSTLIIGTNFKANGNAFTKASLVSTTGLSGGVIVKRDGMTL